LVVLAVLPPLLAVLAAFLVLALLFGYLHTEVVEAVMLQLVALALFLVEAVEAKAARVAQVQLHLQ
jgi:hypothetical protein